MKVAPSTKLQKPFFIEAVLFCTALIVVSFLVYNNFRQEPRYSHSTEIPFFVPYRNSEVEPDAAVQRSLNDIFNLRGYQVVVGQLVSIDNNQIYIRLNDDVLLYIAFTNQTEFIGQAGELPHPGDMAVASVSIDHSRLTAWRVIYGPSESRFLNSLPNR